MAAAAATAVAAVEMSRARIDAELIVVAAVSYPVSTLLPRHFPFDTSKNRLLAFFCGSCPMRWIIE